MAEKRTRKVWGGAGLTALAVLVLVGCATPKAGAGWGRLNQPAVFESVRVRLPPGTISRDVAQLAAELAARDAGISWAAADFGGYRYDLVVDLTGLEVPADADPPVVPKVALEVWPAEGADEPLGRLEEEARGTQPWDSEVELGRLLRTLFGRLQARVESL